MTVHEIEQFTLMNRYIIGVFKASLSELTLDTLN